MDDGSLRSVSGAGLAASLTPIGEGAAMGLLAASSAMATLLGTVLAGPLVKALGYQVVADCHRRASERGSADRQKGRVLT
jgi:hypothetical protein